MLPNFTCYNPRLESSQESDSWNHPPILALRSSESNGQGASATGRQDRESACWNIQIVSYAQYCSFSNISWFNRIKVVCTWVEVERSWSDLVSQTVVGIKETYWAVQLNILGTGWSTLRWKVRYSRVQVKRKGQVSPLKECPGETAPALQHAPIMGQPGLPLASTPLLNCVLPWNARSLIWPIHILQRKIYIFQQGDIWVTKSGKHYLQNHHHHHHIKWVCGLPAVPPTLLTCACQECAS